MHKSGSAEHKKALDPEQTLDCEREWILNNAHAHPDKSKRYSIYCAQQACVDWGAVVVTLEHR